MPSQTTNFDLDRPVGGDAINTTPTTLQSLTNKLDTRVAHYVVHTVTTGSDGRVTVNHGAGFTPDGAIATSNGPAGGTDIFGFAAVETLTSTQAVIRCFKAQDGTALNAVEVDIAVAYFKSSS